MNGCLSILGTALLVIVIIVGGLVVDFFQCYAKTADIGLDSDWSVLAGCRIEHKPDVWIPLKQYRVTEIKQTKVYSNKGKKSTGTN